MASALAGVQMASSSTLFVFLFSLTIFSFSCSSSLFHQPNLKPHPFKLPIMKNPSTNLYYASVGGGTPQHNEDLVIDLLGPSSWYECDRRYNFSSYHPVPCGAQKCPKEAGCAGISFSAFKPGCSNVTCALVIYNFFTEFTLPGDLGNDVLYMFHLRVPRFLAGCSPTSSLTDTGSLLQGLPIGSDGIFGLARTELALPAQLSSAYKLPLKFSLCLPSSNVRGYGEMLVGAH